MRGSRWDDMEKKTEPGIIPAGAGLTPSSAFPAPKNRDHPRGCGAHVGKTAEALEKVGSSPRVRGSLPCTTPISSEYGIIPAGAGLTAAEDDETLRARDHPRGCGAHKVTMENVFCVWGSSPRVRGSPTALGAKYGSTGIIPAGAGLTRPTHL